MSRKKGSWTKGVLFRHSIYLEAVFPFRRRWTRPLKLFLSKSRFQISLDGDIGFDLGEKFQQLLLSSRQHQETHVGRLLTRLKSLKPEEHKGLTDSPLHFESCRFFRPRSWKTNLITTQFFGSSFDFSCKVICAKFQVLSRSLHRFLENFYNRKKYSFNVTMNRANLASY